jgi:hypothetical protein
VSLHSCRGGSRFRDARAQHSRPCRELRAQVLVRHRRGKTGRNRVGGFYGKITSERTKASCLCVRHEAERVTMTLHDSDWPSWFPAPDVIV